MPRTSRMIITNEKAIYHVMSRTALDGFPLKDVEKDLDRSGKPSARVIDKSAVDKERKNDFELKRVRRFRYRTRYFTDSGIIGTKEFVSVNYQRFKDIFMSKREKVPKAVVGLDGVYSLKRLSEMI